MVRNKINALRNCELFKNFINFGFSNGQKTITIIKTEYSIHFLEEAFISMKIMSNEQLVVSYRDALKSDKEKEWIKILKDEIKRRGLKPFKNR